MMHQYRYWAGGAYAMFCDENGLKRIDATPEEHIENLLIMMEEISRMVSKHREILRKKCEHCNGSGISPSANWTTEDWQKDQ